jgi:hypothetical protein
MYHYKRPEHSGTKKKGIKRVALFFHFVFCFFFLILFPFFYFFSLTKCLYYILYIEYCLMLLKINFLFLKTIFSSLYQNEGFKLFFFLKKNTHTYTQRK